jgi:hypothetical protein
VARWVLHRAQPGGCRHLPNDARARTLRRQPPLSWTRCVRWGSAAVGPAVQMAVSGSLAYRRGVPGGERGTSGGCDSTSLEFIDVRGLLTLDRHAAQQRHHGPLTDRCALPAAPLTTGERGPARTTTGNPHLHPFRRLLCRAVNRTSIGIPTVIGS